MFEHSYFPVPASRRAAYQQQVESGYARMRTLNVVLCGLARDVAGVIHKTMARLVSLGEHFNDWSAVIYENDSSDSTRYAIRGFQYLHGFSQIELIGRDQSAPKNPQTRCLARAERMAQYRNELRRYIVEHYPSADYVIVADMDLKGGWSEDGIATTFAHTNWDFVGSNGILFRDYGLEKMKPVYFDVWAFRWPGSDRPTRPEDINPLYWPCGTPFVPVNSCFGGLGVYRYDAFTRCSYDGTDCEHVPFHRRMREAGMGRLFMNPSQIVHYGGAPKKEDQ